MRKEFLVLACLLSISSFGSATLVYDNFVGMGVEEAVLAADQGLLYGSISAAFFVGTPQEEGDSVILPAIISGSGVAPPHRAWDWGYYDLINGALWDRDALADAADRSFAILNI